MRTVKRNPFLSGVCAVLGGAVPVGWGRGGRCYLGPGCRRSSCFPKLVYDSTGRFNLRRLPTDTEIQVTNISS